MITAKAFAGKHYAVYGLARSGIATVEALLASGAKVTAWDAKEEARAALSSSLRAELVGRGTIPRRGNGGGVTGAGVIYPSTSFAGSLPHELRSQGGTRFFIRIPRRDLRPVGEQRLDRRQPAPGKAQHGIMFSGEGSCGDHLSLSVDSPASARMKLMIQKRITTVGSLHPRCSK